MNRIVEKKYKVNTNKNINKRICVISDIHHDIYFTKSFYDKLLFKIYKSNPDYIIIAGDVLDKGEVIENNKSRKLIEYFITNLGRINKTIVTMGNHDLVYKYGSLKDKDKCLNWFKSLNNINNVYFVNNGEVTFENIDFIHYIPSAKWYLDRNKDEYYKEFDRKPIKIRKNSNYKIFISHSPYSITKKENYEKLSEITNNINLIVSGHMHNGVLPEFLEFLDFSKKGIGIVAPNKTLFPKYTRGLHKIKNMDLIVSRGVTKLSHPRILTRFNFIYNKEITIIDLI